MPVSEFQNDWAAGYGWAGFLLFEVMVLCHAGNNVIVVVRRSL